MAGVGALLLASTQVGGAAADPATSPSGHAAAPTSHGRLLARGALRDALNAQPLPTTKRLGITSSSHPFNGAAWQNKPIDLARHGYTEKEYLLSGRSNVYDWTPNGGFKTSVLRSGDYSTRMDVRMPKNMRRWSGKVNVEIINMSAGYDWTAVWSALWQRTLKDHDVYVGLTSKPNVLPGMKQFDPQRYAALSWANPLPPDQQSCGSLPGDAGYNPNLSKLYENGLVWDMLTQAGRLLKSRSRSNPLHRPAQQVLLTGESQSSNYLLTYYRFFTPSAVLRSGKPVFDGYFAETQVGLAGSPINQCATPLAVDDTQRVFPDRAVPWIGVNSQWDYAGARRWTAPADSNAPGARHVFWELAGSNHGWEWQYLYGDADATDLVKAGFSDPATYDWSCGRNNPEVPFYMSEKAAFEQLKTWAATGRSPAHAPRILSKPVTPGDGFDDQTIYDGLGNAMGGIRYPMVEAPVASFGVGQYALTDGCPEIKPLDDATLAALYPTRTNYLQQYDAATDLLLHQRFVLAEDVPRLKAIARRVTAVRDTVE